MYSVDFSQSRIGVNKWVLARLPHHTWKYPCSSGSNAWDKKKGPWRALCCRVSRVRDKDNGIAGRNRREKYFPNKGSLICPQAIQHFFYRKGTERNELAARPATHREATISLVESHLCFAGDLPIAWRKGPPLEQEPTWNLSPIDLL